MHTIQETVGTFLGNINLNRPKTPRGLKKPGVSETIVTDYNEPALIREAQQGDKKAFERLFHRYQKQVSGLAFRIIGDADGAKDATQETFIRLYGSLNKFKHEKRFKSWLYRITVNICYDFLRRENRFKHTDFDEKNLYSTETATDQNELLEKIYNLLELLSTPQKTAFILKEVEGLKYKEIAGILDCPSGTVRSHVFHARMKLKQLMEKHYPELLEK